MSHGIVKLHLLQTSILIPTVVLLSKQNIYIIIQLQIYSLLQTQCALQIQNDF